MKFFECLAGAALTVAAICIGIALTWICIDSFINVFTARSMLDSMTYLIVSGFTLLVLVIFGCLCAAPFYDTSKGKTNELFHKH